MKARNRRMRTCFGAAAAMLMLFGLGAAVWGQSAVGGFPGELKAELQRLGWEQEAIQELEQEAADWSGFEARHARLTATALHYAQSEDGEIRAREQARLAVAVCAMVREMESLGYGESAVARAVFAGVRASLGEMAARRSGDGEGELEERLRSRLHRELRVQTADQVKTQVRESARAERKGDAEGPKIGPGPGDPPGGS